MKRKTLIAIWAVLALMVLAQAASQWKVGDLRQGVGLVFKAPRAGLPTEMVQIMAGEFKGLLADYMVMEIGSFVGSGQKISPAEYKKLYRGLKQALVLDPYFEQTYLMAQGLLPWKGKLVAETIELLDISRRHRFWDWRPGYYMGFDYYYFLGDYAKAADAFLEAGQVKGAPVLLPVLGARFAVKGQHAAAAIMILKNMLADEALSENDRLELKQRLLALEGVQVLETAVERFRAQAGTYPPDLQSLLNRGLINAMPRNPYADHFYYDPQTGGVAFDTVD